MNRFVRIELIGGDDHGAIIRIWLEPSAPPPPVIGMHNIKRNTTNAYEITSATSAYFVEEMFEGQAPEHDVLLTVEQEAYRKRWGDLRCEIERHPDRCHEDKINDN